MVKDGDNIRDVRASETEIKLVNWSDRERSVGG